MKTEKLSYTQNNVFVDAKEEPVIMKASMLSSEPSDIVVKASQGVSDGGVDSDWLSSTTELTYTGGLLSASGTTYSTNNVEEAVFTYESGILKQTVETQTENDGITLRQTRTTDLTYDSEGLLVGIIETVE